MLDTIKTYIKETPNIPFEEYYQRYIFNVQDMNINAEVASVKPDDIISLDRLIAKLHKSLLG